MSWVCQLQAAKFSGMSGKSIIFLDFPRQAGLDAPELPSEHRLKQGCEATRSATSFEVNKVKPQLRQVSSV